MSRVEYMGAFVQAWPAPDFGQQAVGQIPWGPEHTRQISFYLAAVDAQMKAPEHSPTIGPLLWKSKNKVVAEYALRNTTSPMGVAEYQLVEALPKDLETSLPSIEQIERELGEVE